MYIVNHLKYTHSAITPFWGPQTMRELSLNLSFIWGEYVAWHIKWKVSDAWHMQDPKSHTLLVQLCQKGSSTERHGTYCWRRLSPLSLRLCTFKFGLKKNAYLVGVLSRVKEIRCISHKSQIDSRSCYVTPLRFPRQKFYTSTLYSFNINLQSQISSLFISLMKQKQLLRPKSSFWHPDSHPAALAPTLCILHFSLWVLVWMTFHSSGRQLL